MKWLFESGRWKHLVGGIIIGAGANTIYCASYAGVGIASALEFKDKQWGGLWDWLDWSMTIVGVACGYAIRFGILSLIK